MAPPKNNAETLALPTLHSTPRMQLHPSWPGASGEEVSSGCSPPPQLPQEKSPGTSGVSIGPSKPPGSAFPNRDGSNLAGVSCSGGNPGLTSASMCTSSLKPHPSPRAALPLPVDLLSIKPLQRMTCHLERKKIKKKRLGGGERKKKTIPLFF